MKNVTTGRKARRVRSRAGKNSQVAFAPAIVKMDSKQRISLTRMLSQEERENFDTFRIYREGGRIVLEPVVQVPEKDHWIYKDPKALASLIKGIKDAEESRLYDLGSFAKYVEDDEQD